MDIMLHYCMNCMEPLEDDSAVCAKCHYDNQVKTDAPDQLPNTVLNGKYLVGRALGQGGFGITYIGLDLNLLMKVAIKEYYPKDCATRTTRSDRSVIPYTGEREIAFLRGREKFLAEAQMLARFTDMPSIVNVRDYFMEHGTAYIVMDFVQGKTLLQEIRDRGGRLPVAETLSLFRPLMEDLAALHEQHIIHRDISPDNIIINKQNRLILLDFGAARQFAEDEHSYTINLKHGYAPPEQYSAKAEQGGFTDVYALCATIYATIIGKKPPEAIERVMQTEVLVPPTKQITGITMQQERALLHGLETSIDKRTKSVKQVIDELYNGAFPPPKPAPVPPDKPEPKPKPTPLSVTPLEDTSKNPTFESIVKPASKVAVIVLLLSMVVIFLLCKVFDNIILIFTLQSLQLIVTMFAAAWIYSKKFSIEYRLGKHRSYIIITAVCVIAVYELLWMPRRLWGGPLSLSSIREITLSCDIAVTVISGLYCIGTLRVIKKTTINVEERLVDEKIAIPSNKNGKAKSLLGGTRWVVLTSVLFSTFHLIYLFRMWL